MLIVILFVSILMFVLVRVLPGDPVGAAGMPKIRRPQGGLRKAIALAYYAGLRKKDVVELRI